MIYLIGQSFKDLVLECANISNQINITKKQIEEIENYFVGSGRKKPNVKSLIASIKKKNSTPNDTFFKSVNGVISISNAQVNASLDAEVRQKLNTVFTKEITSSAIEPTKTKLLSVKLLQSKSQGVPPALLKKIIENSSRDPDLFDVSGNSTIVYTGGHLLDFSSNFEDITVDEATAPQEEDINEIVDQSFEDINSSQSPPLA
jgi:hypothetical protein